MKLEDQVCPLELAKRLKELGVKQESAFYWCDNNYGTWELEDSPLPAFESDWCSAFTVAELGEMLPSGVTTERILGSMWLSKKKGDRFDATSVTEADARAKMLIHLIENSVLAVPAQGREGK